MNEHCPHCGSNKIVASLSSSLISIGIIPIYNIFCMECGSLIKSTWKRPPEEFFTTPITPEMTRDLVIPSPRPPEPRHEVSVSDNTCDCNSPCNDNNDLISKNESSELIHLINTSETPEILVKKLRST